MKAADRVILAGGGLDRQVERRGASTALLADSAAQVLPLWRGRPLVAGDGAGAVRLALRPANDAFLDAHTGTTVFLGSRGAGPLFATDVSRWLPENAAALDAGPGWASEDQLAPALAGGPADARFADLRGLIAVLAPGDAEIAATAKGILEWHRAHGFCACCGAASVPVEGGWRRACPACSAAHFPRTDPVVIMLVTRGNRLLVGRSPGWPDGFYSLLAGFMEPGETVAAAVRREVAEETAVRVGAVRMLTSQPWPFPASLMIGCIAEATSEEIICDPVEIEDALWLTREELLSVFAGQHPRIGSPRPGTIAHFLMRMWLADRLD